MAVSTPFWVLMGVEFLKLMVCISDPTASSLKISAALPKILSSLSSPRPWIGVMVFHSKQKVSEAVGSPWEKRLGIEIALAGVNDAAASRLFCATLRGNV